MRNIFKQFLEAIVPDADREGLQDTPARMEKAWMHFTSGYAINPVDILKTFMDGAENYDQMILVRDIPVHSVCEHHCIPFLGVAHVAYIPNGRIVGLSKINRVVDAFARRLQVQERLTNQVADALWDNLAPMGVGVVITARHMCVEMRGVSQQGSSTVTSALRGVFEDAEVRAEFLNLIKV
jgi:GTP cyclohydrolase IA